MRRMGRKRTRDKDLPQRVYQRRGAFYFVTKGGEWQPLGKDKATALRAYADILSDRQADTFAAVAELYRTRVLPKKAVETRANQDAQLNRLIAVFGSMPIRSIRRGDFARYRDERGAPVAANRELALAQHLFKRAMEWELCDENPVQGIERFKEKPRQRYPTDDEFRAVFDPAPLLIQVMMGLAVLSGQRESDLLHIRKPADLSKDGIAFTQGKTGKKLIVRWSDPLRHVVQMAALLPRDGVVSTFLVCQGNGQPYTRNGFRNAWQKWMRHCIKKGIIADRFTFHDLRAKAGSDAKDGRLLGHLDPRTLRRIYERKALSVGPTH